MPTIFDNWWIFARLFRVIVRGVFWASGHSWRASSEQRRQCPKLDHLNFFGGRAMFPRMLCTDAIRVPKTLTTFAVSLVLFLAALPAHAQQQGGYRHSVVII